MPNCRKKLIFNQRRKSIKGLVSAALELPTKQVIGNVSIPHGNTPSIKIDTTRERKVCPGETRYFPGELMPVWISTIDIKCRAHKTKVYTHSTFLYPVKRVKWKVVFFFTFCWCFHRLLLSRRVQRERWDLRLWSQTPWYRWIRTVPHSLPAN